MIVLDTHIWVWWVYGDSALSTSTRALLDSSEQTGLGVSATSCWATKMTRGLAEDTTGQRLPDRP